MSAWPWPGDSPVARARRIALAYRAALHDHAPGLAADLDTRFTRWGESWVAPRHVPPGDELVSAEDAGTLIGISSGAIGKLRRDGRIQGVKTGRKYEYAVADVYRLSSEARRRGPHTTDTVQDNGRAVSNDDRKID